MSLLLAILSLIGGETQRYSEDQVTITPPEASGGGGAGVRGDDVVTVAVTMEPDYVVTEPVGISKVSKAEIITSTTLPAQGRVKTIDTGDIEVITPIGGDKYIKTVIPVTSLGADVWREETPVYKGKYQVL